MTGKERTGDGRHMGTPSVGLSKKGGRKKRNTHSSLKRESAGVHMADRQRSGPSDSYHGHEKGGSGRIQKKGGAVKAGTSWQSRPGVERAAALTASRGNGKDNANSRKKECGETFHPGKGGGIGNN